MVKSKTSKYGGYMITFKVQGETWEYHVSGDHFVVNDYARL